MEATTAGAPASSIATPQHLRALKRANAVRMGHCTLKRDVKAGRLTVVAALTDPRATGSFTIASLLCAQRGWAKIRTRKFLYRLGIGETRRVAVLTERQRDLIVQELANG